MLDRFVVAVERIADALEKLGVNQAVALTTLTEQGMAVLENLADAPPVETPPAETKKRGRKAKEEVAAPPVETPPEPTEAKVEITSEALKAAAKDYILRRKAAGAETPVNDLEALLQEFAGVSKTYEVTEDKRQIVMEKLTDDWVPQEDF